MPRIQTHQPGVFNRKAGFHAVQPGEYDYPNEAQYRGWLDGQVRRGAVTILQEPNPLALGPTHDSLPAAGTETEPEPNPLAAGLTPGSTPGAAPDAEPAFAPGAEEPVTPPAVPVPGEAVTQAGRPANAPARGRRNR